MIVNIMQVMWNNCTLNCVSIGACECSPKTKEGTDCESLQPAKLKKGCTNNPKACGPCISNYEKHAPRVSQVIAASTLRFGRC